MKILALSSLAAAVLLAGPAFAGDRYEGQRDDRYDSRYDTHYDQRHDDRYDDHRGGYYGNAEYGRFDTARVIHVQRLGSGAPRVDARSDTGLGDVGVQADRWR